MLRIDRISWLRTVAAVWCMAAAVLCIMLSATQVLADGEGSEAKAAGNGAASGQGAALDDQAKRELATKVVALFELYCVECHGPDVKKPKAGFGHILPLKDLVTDDKYIVPGDADASDINYQIEYGFMPPREKLSKEQKDMIRRWIEVGAPTEVVSLGDTANNGGEAGTAGSDAGGKGGRAASDRDQKGTQPIGRWLGRFHPLAVHFPIALLTVAALAQLLALVTRRDGLRSTARFALWIGTLGAIAAAASGYLNATYEGWTSDAAERHMWAGFATVGFAILTTVVYEISVRKQSLLLPALLTIMLIALAGLVGLTGHYGGILTHGADALPF